MQNFFDNPSGSIVDPLTIFINLVVTVILCFIIAIVYKNTHKGLSYSQSFVFTLILGGMIISAVMMVIGNSVARAFGAFGAFSLIRFRTAIKDTKDMAYIFLVLAVGMAVGTENYLVAFFVTLLSIVIIYILTKVNFGSVRKYDYILTFYLNTELASSEIYKSLFDKSLKTSNLLHIDAKEGGRVLKLTFSVKFFGDSDTAKFLNELSQFKGINDANLINAKSDIEY